MKTGDFRPISDTVYDTAINKRPTVVEYDTATNEMPTIGAFIYETLDMQADTFATMNNIAKTMWGEEITAPPFTPKENVMAGLAAIQENQRAILTAVKAIADKL